LIDHFLNRFWEGARETAPRFSNEATRLLLSSPWPGNVRELQNAVEHALAMRTGPTLKISDLPSHICGDSSGKARTAEVSDEPRSLKEAQRRHILRILEEAGGNHVQAARILGIDRRTLYRQLASL